MNLSDNIEQKFRLDENQKKALRRLNLFSMHDLLFHFPTRYSDMSEVKKIVELVPGEVSTIFGKISGLKTKKAFHSKIPMAEGEVEDVSGKIKIIWFNQAYLAKMLKNGENAKLTGTVTDGKYGLYLANPEVEKSPNMPIDVHDTLFKESDVENSGFSFPVYRETRGITSRWFYHAIEKILKEKILDDIVDPIPLEITKKYNLPSLKTALVWIHKPKNKKDSEAARKRFAFEEIFYIQLKRQQDKKEYAKNKSFEINFDNKKIENFISQFPFTPTKSQTDAIDTVLKDISKDSPMSRLLEGDVGSGKTAVAATATYAVITQSPKDNKYANLQVAYMAPTEILATQHFESFIKYFSRGQNINVALITGKTCRKFPSKVTGSANGGLNWTDISRAQLLKWVANGEIPILIGTHTLIQKSVKFKNLALAIIDEQHRFGTGQRKKLVSKEGFAPHLLSMTATPIPRTLALTIYGDLDLSLLSEMPKGRKEIITEIVTPDKREETYEKIKKELENGRQLYIICPRIDEPDPSKELALQAKSVSAEAKRLKQNIFRDYEIGILHSKMSKQKKEEVMNDFSSGKIDILCATSVVEVGVNVPNATMIVIEGAERFGLAQLHQLRGRVIRSNHQAYCYVFAEAKSEKTIGRLKALKNAKNGFELSELDLALRGSGELGGGKQWGISDLGMEAIKNIKMVEAARTEAINLIEQDFTLKDLPLLREMINKKAGEFHFE